MRARSPEPQLSLIVGAARSGTTLLRVLLDAHPEIGCPGEAGIPSLIQDLGRVWWTIGCDRNSAGEGFAELSDLAKTEIRRAVLAPMSDYCGREGKRIYCDKSLDSVDHLELVRELFPDARYVLLFRHVMDTVASGLEASPWGFQAYGYAPFVQASPGNLVVALANYWLTHVDKALRWQEDHPELCQRVRYEDLVRAPRETIVGILEFLGVGIDLSVLDKAFERARNTMGPGDHKVGYTSSVHASSIGHGKRVPVSLIPPPQLEAVNAKLSVLGYEELGPAWNAEPRLRGADAGSVWGERLAELMGGLQIAALSNGDGPGSFAVVAEDHAELRWVVEPLTGELRQGDGEVESVVTGTAEDLALMIAEQENLGVLLRSGRVRHLTARDGVPPDEVARTISGVLDLLRAARSLGNGSESAGDR
jgi:protein-tyrosine sulfotransferase